MASNYQFGRSQEDLLGDLPRYFYALRRTDEGELYFARVDQLSRVDSVQINAEGTSNDNVPEFEPGVDFFEGRDVQHELVFDNLNYEQMRWDNRDLYYYIDDAGNLVVRTNTKYQYPTGI
jgi:hypothetical protein